MNYIDQHGKRIKEGDIIIIGDGKPEVVYATMDSTDGTEDLGVNASNLGWLERALDKGLDVQQEFYPLSQFKAGDISRPPDCFNTNGEKPYPLCVGKPEEPCPGCRYYLGGDPE